MSITVKLVTKKLGFLSSVQPMMCSTSRVILVHRRFLTSQTLSSHLEKLPETRCFTNTYLVKSKDSIPSSKSECICFGSLSNVSTADSSAPILKNVALNQLNRTSEFSVVKTNELEHLLRLQTKPCCGTTDDIILRENYVPFNVSNQEDQHTRLNFSASNQNDSKPSNETGGGRPTDEQLINVREVLAKTLPVVFVYPLDYRIYHPDILFINNIRGTQSQGIFSYMKTVAILRALGHIKFAYVKFEILKITSHPEDGTVKMRWRIRGIKGYMAVWNVVRYQRWRAKDQMEHQDLWYDGFSTYFVGSDGRVFKHVADKVMPDDDRVVEKTKTTPLASKLAALCVGVALSAKDSILPTSHTDPVETKHL